MSWKHSFLQPLLEVMHKHLIYNKKARRDAGFFVGVSGDRLTETEELINHVQDRKLVFVLYSSNSC